MRWTDRRSDHADEVARLRAELYDDTARVAERWRRRLLATGDVGRLDGAALRRLCRQAPVTIVFGSRELLYRAQVGRLRALAGECPRLRVRVVRGGHDVGTFSSDAAAAAVADALQ
jgi:hypothetical protein